MTDTQSTPALRAHQVAESLRADHARLVRELSGMDWESAAAARFRAGAELQLRGLLAGAEASDQAADALARLAHRVAEERQRLADAAHALLSVPR